MERRRACLWMSLSTSFIPLGHSVTIYWTCVSDTEQSIWEETQLTSSSSYISLALTDTFSLPLSVMDSNHELMVLRCDISALSWWKYRYVPYWHACTKPSTSFASKNSCELCKWYFLTTIWKRELEIFCALQSCHAMCLLKYYKYTYTVYVCVGVCVCVNALPSDLTVSVYRPLLSTRGSGCTPVQGSLHAPDGIDTLYVVLWCLCWICVIKPFENAPFVSIRFQLKYIESKDVMMDNDASDFLKFLVRDNVGIDLTVCCVLSRSLDF